MTSWQPMGSAPRDGSPFVAYKSISKRSNHREVWGRYQLVRWNGTCWMTQMAGGEIEESRLLGWLPMPAFDLPTPGEHRIERDGKMETVAASLSSLAAIDEAASRLAPVLKQLADS